MHRGCSSHEDHRSRPARTARGERHVPRGRFTRTYTVVAAADATHLPAQPDRLPEEIAMTGRAAAAPGNMPTEMTTFIGRRQLLQNVKAALGSARLVTLTGPGGVGKTRLAHRSAADLNRGIADGVWLVELGSLQEPEFVTKAVMTALGLRDESSQWPVSRLIDHIATKRILIVLDN